jgi:RimJ/RimL family protein N-acetyltransferase
MGELRIETDRLVLREWREEDAIQLLPIGQDERVRQFLGPKMDAVGTRLLIEGQMLNQSLFGHCFWAMERRSDGELIGDCGLNPAPAGTPVEGCIEIGWQLVHRAWGQGYAREAAEATLNWAWCNLLRDEIVSFTVPMNQRSRGLMERLGMIRRPDLDFDHPSLAVDDPLRRHIVYSIARPL